MPFREPGTRDEAPPVSTDELEAMLRKRARRMQLGIALGSLSIVLIGAALVGYPYGVEAYYRYQARKHAEAYRSLPPPPPAPPSVPLTDDRRARVQAVIDKLEKSSEEQKSALRTAWAAMIEDGVVPRPDLGKCPHAIPPPDIRDEKLEDGGTRVKIEWSQRSPAAWMWIDGREEKYAKKLLASLPARVRKEYHENGDAGETSAQVLGLAPAFPAPVPKTANDLGERITALHEVLDRKWPLERQDGVVADAEGMGNDPPVGGDEYIAVVDLWVDPHVAEPTAKRHSTFEAGVGSVRAFVYDPIKGNVVCAAHVLEESSERLVFENHLQLRKDLGMRLEKAIAEQSYVAGKPKR